MRMTASWSGTLWTDRIQGCGAMIRARWQAPPLIVDARLSPTNLSSSLRTVSDSVARGGNRDGWSARASQQGDRAASAASDARKGWKLKLVRPGPKQWPWSGRKRSRPRSLDIRRPIQGLLGLHSRYGLSDCSAAQGDLCHEPPALPVTRPSRSSATRAIDNSLGGTFLHW